MNDEEKIFENIARENRAEEIFKSEDCEIWKMKNSSGDGLITMYNVFPGVIVMYSDFHMSSCISEFDATSTDLLCINHCREGCMESELRAGAYYYIEKGDLCVDIRKYHAGNVNFPLNHYHGIGICFYRPVADKQLANELSNFPVKLSDIQKKFCDNDKPHIIKASKEIEHIFSELYEVPSKIRKEYYRIKVFELLLYLDALEIDKNKFNKPYFYKSQVEKVKNIHELITHNLTYHYTIEELSEKYDISATALKECFKSIYGSPIYKYIQTYRINRAATLLRNGSNENVSQIAGHVGYDSPSKFAAAFKKIMGVTPLQYRKNNSTLPL